MSETRSGRPALWIAVLAVLVAAAIWATVAMAAGGSRSSGSGSPAASFAASPMYAATGGSNAQGDCPNMGGSGGGNSTTPSTPSTQNGSSNPGL
jgi:hypothetical protein